MKDGSLEWPEGTRRHPVCIRGCLFLRDTLCSLHYLLALLCLPEVQTSFLVFKWFIPIVCDCNIKYQKYIGWVRQNTTLYYGVGCPKGTTCLGPLL